jgi:hypothetical protein
MIIARNLPKSPNNREIEVERGWRNVSENPLTMLKNANTEIRASKKGSRKHSNAISFDLMIYSLSFFT